MKALLVVAAALALLTTPALALFTAGEAVAIFVVVAVLVVAILAFTVARRFLVLITVAIAAVVVATIAYAGYSGYQLYSALSDNDGPVDPPDPAALASANAKLDEADAQAGFRVEMTVAEITAVLQDALANNDDNPLRRVDLTIVDGSNGESGRLEFKGHFKNGDITASGVVRANIEAGAIKFDVSNVDLGNFKIPGLAKGAVRDLIEAVTDLNETLEEHNADVQSVFIGENKVVVTGVQGDGELVTLGSLLGRLRENVNALGAKATPPAETLGPGDVNAISRDGSKYYVAIGDSLAANVGVGSPREGYVSRFLKQIDAKEGTRHGLRNFGVSGETSSGLIRGGQLDSALDFIDDEDTAYVTIDIGANDFLGHLYSPDCSETLQTPACKERLEQAIAVYEKNLDTILSRLEKDAKDATIVFLGMYNPFSIGFGSAVGLEGETDAIVQRVNKVASEAATRHRVTFADGEPAIRGRAGAVTHMLDAQPDIHPKAIGYDLLAAVLFDAVK